MDIRLKVGLLFDSSWSISTGLLVCLIVAVMVGYIVNRICCCIEHENEHRIYNYENPESTTR